MILVADDRIGTLSNGTSIVSSRNEVLILHNHKFDDNTNNRIHVDNIKNY